jgi:hypothetical protein
VPLLKQSDVDLLAFTAEQSAMGGPDQQPLLVGRDRRRPGAQPT